MFHITADAKRQGGREPSAGEWTWAGRNRGTIDLKPGDHAVKPERFEIDVRIALGLELRKIS